MCESGEDENELEAIAYHEAGHAVMYIELHRRFKRVTIIPDEKEGYAGCVERLPEPKWYDPEHKRDRRHRIYLEKEARIGCAGTFAEVIHTGRHDPEGRRDDLRRVNEIVTYLEVDDRDRERYVEELLIEVKKTLQAPQVWASVQGVASALLKRGELSYREARRLILEARGALEVRTASLSSENGSPRRESSRDG